jgi:hypothetical protein
MGTGVRTKSSLLYWAGRIIMKKCILLYLLFLITLLLVPLPATALNTLSDSELESVSGQTGVDIYVIDVSLDLDLMNVSWSDSDCGTLIISTVPVAYTPGYINVFDIEMRNVYITMDTGASGIASDSCGTFVQYSSHPLTIDVITGSTNPRENPFCTLRGKTGVVMGLPDLYLAVQELDIGGIYLDSESYTVQTATYLSNEKWQFTRAVPDKTKSFYGMQISGIEATLHAYVGGYETANLTPGQSIHPIHPNHRAMVIISPH